MCVCVCVCVENKPNYVYLNIISTGVYTTFIGGEILCRLI